MLSEKYDEVSDRSLISQIPCNKRDISRYIFSMFRTKIRFVDLEEGMSVNGIPSSHRASGEKEMLRQNGGMPC